MPFYRRAHVPGGMFFFTLVTERRAPILCEPLARRALRKAIADCRRRRPFALQAMVLLPEHLHFLVKLPEDDADFSIRLAAIKAVFTRRYLQAGGAEQARSGARVRKRRRGVWQRWFWEHTIRDAEDLARHMDYIHYNPVKHGLVRCPHEWPYSSLQRHVREGTYPNDWQCACEGRRLGELCFEGLNPRAMEWGE